jgi:hypothetical protein
VRAPVDARDHKALARVMNDDRTLVSNPTFGCDALPIAENLVCARNVKMAALLPAVLWEAVSGPEARGADCGRWLSASSAAGAYLDRRNRWRLQAQLRLGCPDEGSAAFLARLPGDAIRSPGAACAVGGTP